MSLASLSTDPAVVDLFVNRIGMSGYPSNMEDLFSTTWFDQEYYLERSGFVIDADTGGYVRGNLGSATQAYVYGYYDSMGLYNSTTTEFIPSESGTYYASSWRDAEGNSVYASSLTTATKYRLDYYIVDDLCSTILFPSLDVPAFMTGSGIPTNAQYPSVYEYPTILAANIVSRNPTGFNAIVDNVKSVALGTVLNTIIAQVEGMSDTERVLVPSFLIAAYADEGVTVADIEEYMNGSVISLGKAELLLWIADIKLNRAFVQYLASVDFSYNISAITGALTDVEDWDEAMATDTDSDGIPDLIELLSTAAPGFYNSNLLKERSATDRAASKASFLSAVASLKAAGLLLQTQWADSSSYYQGIATNLELNPDIRNSVAPALESAIQAATALANSVDANSLFYVPVEDIYNGAFNVAGFTWPTAEPAEGGTETIACKPGALWASNVLDPRSWMETDAGGFTEYISYDTETADTFSFNVGCIPYSASMTMAQYGDPANNVDILSVMAAPVLLLKNSRFQEFYPAYPSDFQMILPLGPSWPVYDSATPMDVLPQPPEEVMFFFDWMNK